MKTSLLIAASGLALGVVGCAPAATRATLTRLDCPATQGELTRASAAADGKSCLYRTREGEEINLQLVAVQGDAKATLERLAASLKAAALGPAGAAAAKAEPGNDTAAEAARVEAEARADASAGDDATNRDVDIAAADETKTVADDGETRTNRVDLPGIHIASDEGQDNAQVHIGGLNIDAAGGKAEINVMRDVRLRGQALSREKNGLRATYVYAGKDLPGGYRFVGYEAAGPKTGPLVVATVKSKADPQLSGDHDEANRIYPDVKKLVRRNGGA